MRFPLRGPENIYIERSNRWSMIWQGHYGQHIALSAGASHSEILYIVIITIICAIYTLYVVFVLIWLHLSSIVINSVSRSTYGVSL